MNRSGKRTSVFLYFLSRCYILVFICQCSGPYLKNRLRDAGDIVTLELQRQSYGASLHISALSIGASYRPETARASGLRAGQAGTYTSSGFTALAFGADYFLPEAPDFDRSWKPELTEDEYKEIVLAELSRAGKRTGAVSSESDLPSALTAELERRLADFRRKKKQKKALALSTQESLITKRRKSYKARLPFGTQAPAYRHNHLLKPRKSKKDEVGFAPAYFYTRLEIQLGVGYGIRLGLNPGELLDFLVGWTTLDLYDDDSPYEDTPEERLKKDPRFQKLPPALQEQMLHELRRSGATQLPF